MSAQSDQDKMNPKNPPQVNTDDDMRQKQSQTGNKGTPGAGSQPGQNTPQRDQGKGMEGNRPQRDDEDRSARDDQSGGMKPQDDDQQKSGR